MPHLSARASPASPPRLLPLVPALGEVMALTRSDSAVHEKVGTHTTCHEGPHAGLTPGDIDLRIFPAHWVQAFAVEKGNRRRPAPQPSGL